MRKFQAATVLATLVLSCSSCFARIGETRAECVKRYGPLSPHEYKSKEDETPPNSFEFEKGPIQGSLVFDSAKDDAKCVSLYMNRSDMQHLVAEIRVIMQANKGNSDWKMTSQVKSPLGPRTHFETLDGRLRATVLENRMFGYLRIETSEWQEQTKNAEREKQRQGVSGF